MIPAEAPAADSVDLAESASGLVAAYVHIPFCRRVCPYCDFAVTSDTTLAERYVTAVIGEIEEVEPFDQPLAAIAIGGGTPTSIDPGDLGRIIGALTDRLGLAPGAEISVEANPEDVGPSHASALAAAGVTRLSLGVQSFDEAVLGDLGRIHDAAAAREATLVALEEFAAVNVDLIYGSPAETDESWRHSVETALDLGIHHLSTYALTVERGTALSRSIAAGAPAPDPDAQADRWGQASEMAAAAGLDRYEISNHARPGGAVVYNLITWGQGDYAGFGTGAHSHRSGFRSWNVRRVDRYVERIEAGERAESGSERIAGWDREVERVMLGLRRAAGVAAGPAGTALVGSERGAALVAAGVLVIDDRRLRVGAPMLTDEVARTLLALDPTDC